MIRYCTVRYGTVRYGIAVECFVRGPRMLLSCVVSTTLVGGLPTGAMEEKESKILVEGLRQDCRSDGTLCCLQHQEQSGGSDQESCSCHSIVIHGFTWEYFTSPRHTLFSIHSSHLRGGNTPLSVAHQDVGLTGYDS